MTDQQDPHREQYDRARNAFDELQIEEKAIFLLKEAVNTLVQGVEDTTRTLVDEVEALFGWGPAPGTAEEAAHENGAETEAAVAEEQAAPKKAAPKKTGTTRKRSTGAKAQSKTTKSTAKKTTSTRRRAPKKDDGDDA